jgi:hypothetical protein
MADSTNERKLTERGSHRPDEIASDLWGTEHSFEGGKRIRNYLRANLTRAPELKGTAWVLAPDVAAHVFEIFSNMTVTEVPVVTLADMNSAKDSTERK